MTVVSKVTCDKIRVYSAYLLECVVCSFILSSGIIILEVNVGTDSETCYNTAFADGIPLFVVGNPISVCVLSRTDGYCKS